MNKSDGILFNLITLLIKFIFILIVASLSGVFGYFFVHLYGIADTDFGRAIGGLAGLMLFLEILREIKGDTQ